MKIIIGVYFVIQILVLSSLMVLEIPLVLHAITMALACMFYLIVAFKNPGHYESKQKKISISDQINHQKAEQGMREIDQAQEQLQSQNQKNSIENKVQQKSKRSINKSQNKNQSQNVHKAKSIKNRLNNNNSQVKRYCRICRVDQPLRVRHCHQCEKCIYTFDHHCPWMDNCIGQKNRYLFWIYLVVQFLQFLFANISVFKAIQNSIELDHAYFFAIGLTLVMLVSLALLSFHSYLILVNLTTWEFVRWDRIQYLKNTQIQGKKRSPFSRGWNNNIADYFISGWKQEPTHWEIQVTGQKLTKKEKKIKIKQKPQPQTERVIARTYRDQQQQNEVQAAKQ